MNRLLIFGISYMHNTYAVGFFILRVGFLQNLKHKKYSYLYIISLWQIFCGKLVNSQWLIIRMCCVLVSTDICVNTFFMLFDCSKQSIIPLLRYSFSYWLSTKKLHIQPLLIDMFSSIYTFPTTNTTYKKGYIV